MTAPRLPRLDDIRARLQAAFRGPWGVMHDGPKGDGEPWVAHMEAAPGLTVGAVEHTEPVARVSGYLYDVKANAALISHAPEDIAFLLALVEKQREALQHVADSGTDITVQRHGEILPIHCQLCDAKIMVAKAAIGNGGDHV